MTWTREDLHDPSTAIAPCTPRRPQAPEDGDVCGIAGFWQRAGAGADLEWQARRMAEAIAWRGPDDQGTWADPKAGIALGHRRLAVLDLTDAAHQPMTSPGGRYVLAYNGECYNFRDLREDLERTGHRFEGTGDTEVLLAGFEAWGIEATLQRVVGMFAVAVWDRSDGSLVLARDRFGEKPLYYGVHGGVLLFASQPSALRAHPAFRPAVDRTALAQYVRLGFVPVPLSIHEGIHKLPPGTVLRIPRDRRTEPPEPSPYWSAQDEARHASSTRRDAGDEERIDHLEGVLRDAVRACLVSDVPVGVFLSGGVDSSTVAALAQGLGDRPVRTFTIGFREAGYDEAGHARAVAEHLGTQHTELVVTPEQAREVIPLLPSIYDEPFADSSQIPTYLVCRLAREAVTVCLSGDGGDELFGGYNRHVLLSTWPRIRRLPRPVRRVLARGLAAPRPAVWDALVRILPASRRPGDPAGKARKLAAVLAARDDADAHDRLVSLWDPSEVLVGHGDADPAAAPAPGGTAGGPGGAAEEAMLRDTAAYLPDDILVKLDRASMAVSLEGRAPLLDPRVFRAAWSLPPHLRIRDGRGKHALRRVLERHVTPALTERPKQGFAVPVGAWLRGPLREWAERLLDEDRLRREGYLDPDAVRRRWREHLSGRRDWQHHLWCILMFQAWLERWGD